MARLTLDWVQLATAVGALHGVLLAVVLFLQHRNRTANRLLGVLVVAFTVYLASTVYYTAGVIRVWPHFFGVSYQTPWIFGPLVYLYALAASDRSWRFRRRALLHFLPVAISIGMVMPYYLMSGADKIVLYDQMAAGHFPRRIAWFDPFKYVSGMGYSIATVLYLRRHRRRVEDSYSNTARVNLAWLVWLTVAAMGTWILATMLRIFAFDSVRDEPVSLAIALIIYAIGYMGMRQPEVFRYETAEFPVVTLPPETPTPASPTREVEESARYERSGLSEGEARALEERLRAMMESERPWTDSELTLADLAERLDTSPHKLSEVLNAQVGETFYDFVNGYRVREVQRRIEAGEARRRKMLALAMDAGFASKSTFNQVFKKHTSRTPSDFREAVGA